MSDSNQNNTQQSSLKSFIEYLTLVVALSTLITATCFNEKQYKFANEQFKYSQDQNIAAKRQSDSLLAIADSNAKYQKSESDSLLKDAQLRNIAQQKQFIETIETQKKQVEALFSSNKLFEEQMNIGIEPDIDLIFSEPKLVYFIPNKFEKDDWYFNNELIFSNQPLNVVLGNAYKVDTIFKERRLDKNAIVNLQQGFSLLLLNNGADLAKNVKIEMNFDTTAVITFLSKMNPVGKIRYTPFSFRREQGNYWKMPISRSDLQLESNKYEPFIHSFTKFPNPIKIDIPSVYLDFFCWVLFEKYKMTNNGVSIGNNYEINNKFPPLKIRISYTNRRKVESISKFDVYINAPENGFNGGFPVLDINSIHAHLLMVKIKKL